MSISSVGSNNSLVQAQLLALSPTSTGSPTSDGSSSGNGVSATSGQGGKFLSAISQALSQLAASSGTTAKTSATSSDSSAQDPQQALASFMQNLFAALQPQSGQQTAASGGSDSAMDATGAVAGASGQVGAHHHHHGGGMGKLEGGLQNLIQQLSASSSGSGTSDSSTSGSGTSDSTMDALQQSFNNLLSADGVSSGNATLSGFLQSLSQNLQGAPATGNVVTTTA